MSKPLLEYSDVKIEYQAASPVEAVGGVSFSLQLGENIGLVGESGCGKTTIAKSILGLLPSNGRVTSGRIIWDGEDITDYTGDELTDIRWKEIAIIPQSAMNSLDPVYRIRDQIVEAIRAHEKVSKNEARSRAVDLCNLVGIEPKRLNDYPHQLSGGMKQRMVIAMALALNPRLIIADEPTTALDVIVQDRILHQIIELQHDLQFAMIYISHDIAVISETCQSIKVMYAGKIVEHGNIKKVLKDPTHPYTMGLKNAFPDIRNPHALISIPGHPPNLNPPPTGCRFAPRCPFVADICSKEEPGLVEVTPEQYAACHFTDQARELRVNAAKAETWQKSLIE